MPLYNKSVYSDCIHMYSEPLSLYYMQAIHMVVLKITFLFMCPKDKLLHPRVNRRPMREYNSQYVNPLCYKMKVLYKKVLQANKSR